MRHLEVMAESHKQVQQLQTRLNSTDINSTSSSRVIISEMPLEMSSIAAVKSENEGLRQRVKELEERAKKGAKSSRWDQDEMSEMVQLIKTYEEQMSEIQGQLEAQIQIEISLSKELESEREAKASLEE